MKTLFSLLGFMLATAGSSAAVPAKPADENRVVENSRTKPYRIEVRYSTSGTALPELAVPTGAGVMVVPTPEFLALAQRMSAAIGEKAEGQLSGPGAEAVYRVAKVAGKFSVEITGTFAGATTLAGTEKRTFTTKLTVPENEWLVVSHSQRDAREMGKSYFYAVLRIQQEAQELLPDVVH